MPRVGFEPTAPVFERVKTVHALERAATVIGDEITLKATNVNFHRCGNLKSQKETEFQS
jgi:hypothetical protein